MAMKPSPAREARLKPDDEILEMGGHLVANVPDFRGLVVTTPSPTMVRFKRDGKEMTVKVELRGTPVQYGFEWRVDETEPDSIIVTFVLPGSPAGLKRGHRILKVGEYVPGTRDEFRERLKEAKGELRLEVERLGKFSVLKLQKFPPD